MQGSELDSYATVRREWGLPGQSEAGKAKMEVGRHLLEMLVQEDNLQSLRVGDENHTLNEYSGLIIHNGNNITARLGEFNLNIYLSAEHHNKPKKDHTHSLFYVGIYPGERYSIPVMHSDLVKRMIEYLDQYQYQPK